MVVSISKTPPPPPVSTAPAGPPTGEDSAPVVLFAGLGLIALAGISTGVGLCCYIVYSQSPKETAAGNQQSPNQLPIPMAVSVSMTDYGQPESNWTDRPLGHPLRQPAGALNLYGTPPPMYPGAPPQAGEPVFAHCQGVNVAIAHPIRCEGKSTV